MFKKEYYKFREFLWIFVAIICAFLIYFFFFVKNFVASNDAVSLNLGLLYTKSFSFFGLDVLNIIFAPFIGAIVFIKERIGGRLRLSLHFPNSMLKNISYIIFSGFGCVCVVYLLEFVIFNAVLAMYFHTEFIFLINSHLYLSYIFGLNLYLLVGAIIIEPAKKRVFSHAFFGLFVLYFYTQINPPFSQIPSFYYNENAKFYMIISYFYALIALLEAFKNYKKGYIK